MLARPYSLFSLFFFFFNDTATTEIYTLSLHDAFRSVLSTISARTKGARLRLTALRCSRSRRRFTWPKIGLNGRSEEHTSELQSRQYLVCRLLLEKKKKKKKKTKGQDMKIDVQKGQSL